ncbi:hypothetical protein PAXINDRAFT_70789, partial [Paxillus involutus ATCC 200175]
EAIPVERTPILAARAMDVSNSTVVGNIQSVINLMQQGGVEDPAVIDDDATSSLDVSEYVALFHGDLGTGEQLQAVQQRRAIETTAYDCFQHVVFIPGLFHLKMASADALWRTFLQPSAAHEDEICLMHDVGVLWPHETGLYGSKPGFRRMHQLIMYGVICHCLDCWRAEMKKRDSLQDSLNIFVKSEPSFEDLENIANKLAKEYVATYKLR